MRKVITVRNAIVMRGAIAVADGLNVTPDALVRSGKGGRAGTNSRTWEMR